jgi:DNA-binding NarL/FixJ family response regulator
VLIRAGEPAGGRAAGRRRFTAREIEVLEQVIGGATNKAIGYDLGLSPSTVATHVSVAMAKLGVRSRVELIEKLCRAPLIWRR